MDDIQLATPEQIKSIEGTSDLGPTSTVYAMGEDLAVVKQVMELDPVYFKPESTPARRLLFIWGLENMMRGVGISAYYFNCPTDATEWKHVIETHGAEQINHAAEYRYKKLLIKGS